ncbi:MAG: glucoamylase family protein, partial [Pseudomonadota bacterium]
RDFGYLPAGGAIRRTRDALAAMQRLERYRGHFYNWYETRTLQPLLPLYVSSVDSGNLAGHLLTLGSGLRELADEKICTPQIFTGLRDTVGVLRELVPENAALAGLDGELAQAPAGLQAAHALLERVTDQAVRIADALASERAELKDWGRTLQRNCAEHLEELRFLAPWLATPEASPGGFTSSAAGPGEKSLPPDPVPTLREVSLLDRPDGPLSAEGAGADFARHGRQAGERARERLAALAALAREADELAAMDFTFLFDPARDLFSPGFNATERRRDPGFYDLLASEARLCSYVAIALGQVHQEHWFSLGRLLVAAHGEPVLVSWSGSMFEYLMPLLVMPNYENTLLDHTCRAAVGQQIEYGRLHGLPWGISESGYNRSDAQLNYQYRAFGVPGLGLKRGLADDLVIAPYASAMALMVAPAEACANLQRLEAEGRAGAYGFYEAVDYTAKRLPPDETSVTIRSFMVHHQGMSLLALANVLHDSPMQRRFLACPLLRAADLLLQERVPKAAASVFTEDLTIETSRKLAGEVEGVARVFTTPSASAPEVNLLSNGRYHVVVSSAGGGYSRWRDLAVTRWREDATRDCWGSFVYFRDLATGDFWSAAHQPALRATPVCEVVFTQARAEFRQRPAGLDIHTELCVSPEDDVELRRITIANRSAGARTIELTSYAEVVLAPPAADAAHPAFSNLFVQTEFMRPAAALLCTRRASSPEEKPPWLLHLIVGQGGEQGEISCETDRARFIGRGGTLAAPVAMQGAGPLSNTAGSVLDPIVSLRRRVSLPAYETAVIDLVTGMAESREAALALVEKYQGARMADRAFDLAWTHSQVTLRHLNATEGEAQLYGRLAGALVYADPARRAGPGILRDNRRGQSGLWSYGISGDAPIVLLRISDPEKIELVRQLIQAHSYWRMKGLIVE